ncbi:MAG TPA: ferritin family protein [Bacillales bacterium]|nr:ferritin family protein [Bacillales bacterium]
MNQNISPYAQPYAPLTQHANPYDGTYMNQNVNPYANPYMNPVMNQNVNPYISQNIGAMMNQKPKAGLIDDLAKAINGQYSAIKCYEKIAALANNEKEKERILEIRKDEMRHYRTFARMYGQVTGEDPKPEIVEECPQDYCRALAFAVEDEQKTVDFYNEIADRAQNPYIRHAFARAALDEQNHAVWFLYFYTKHNGEK